MDKPSFPRGHDPANMAPNYGDHFEQGRRYKPKGISEKNKKHLKDTVAVLIGFLLGLVTRFFLGLLL